MVTNPQAPLRLIRAHPEGERFLAGRYLGECSDCGVRVNATSFAVRRGDRIYHAGCPSVQMMHPCPLCGTRIADREGLACDTCYPVYNAVLWLLDGLRDFYAPVREVKWGSSGFVRRESAEDREERAGRAIGRLFG